MIYVVGSVSYSFAMCPPWGGPAGVTHHMAGSRGGGRGGARPPPPPTTGRATPPGGVGVDRRREIPRIVARHPRDNYDSVPHAKKWGKSPFIFEGNREVVVAEGCCNNAVDFSASIHSHTTWGGGAPGGWGRTGGLGPPAAPSRDPSKWRVDPRGPTPRGHTSQL